MKNLIYFVGIGLVCTIALSMYSGLNTETINNCKVINLQQQNVIKNDEGIISTRIRYLVITNKETFVCENAYLQGKFNNSDIFYRLQKDSTYNFKVAGVGKSMLTDYRNIIEIIK